METAPRNGKAIVILTPLAAHNAEWDKAFSNFWSNTAGRAIEGDEAVGWMSAAEWLKFVCKSKQR